MSDPTLKARSRSIGDWEAAAGIAPDHASRWAFWSRFASIRPAGAALDAGVAELRRLAEVQAAEAPA